MTDAELVVELTARRDYHRDQAERLNKAIEALEGDEAAPAPKRAAAKKPKAKEGKQGPRPTGTRRRLTAEDEARVRELKKAGKSWAEIRAATGFSTSSIARILKG